MLRMNQCGYLLPPEEEGQFSVSDLVWGKVRSHPWWPGQIFDPADASEKAVKYYKKDSFLVAYFGDGTFAWNDASVLKPFRSHFPQIEKQSNSETFQNAVSCALEEVSRRVELGLACPCIPKDAYGKIEYQVVENTGICEQSSIRYGLDQSTTANSFEPHRLIEYLRALAPSASYGADKLDIVIARAQLSAFCRFKGYRPPTEFVISGDLAENNAAPAPVTEALDDSNDDGISAGQAASNKRKYTPKEILQPRKKERSLTDLMGDVEDDEDESLEKDGNKSVSQSSGRKRKASGPLSNESDRRVSIYSAKVSTINSANPKPSFKIGECIRRVASQLTGTLPLSKGQSEQQDDGSLQTDEHSKREGTMAPMEFSSVDEMLLQLQSVAQEPMKGHSSLNTIITFFSGFRSSIVLNKRGRKKKVSQPGGSTEEFEFDDINDSYWTDRIVHNYPEEQLLQNGENGGEEQHQVSYDPEKPQKPGRRSQSKKRYSSGNAAGDSDEFVDKKQRESSPAELILNFAERDSFPSEMNLNKVFRRFGPLMESETEVDRDSGRAKVIFKRGADAEVAYDSSVKFNIFGSVLVNYQLSYSPAISFRTSPLEISHG